MTASTKKMSKGAGKGRMKPLPAAKSTTTSKSAKKSATAKPAAVKKTTGKKPYSRDGRWRLLGSMLSARLRRHEIGKNGNLSETTLHNNLTSALEEKLVEKDEASKTFQLTEKGRTLYLKHVQTAGPSAQTEAAPAKVSATPVAMTAVVNGATAAPKPAKSSAESTLPPTLVAALSNMVAPHSIARIDAKLALLEALAPKVPVEIGNVLLEIATDLRRMA